MAVARPKPRTSPRRTLLARLRAMPTGNTVVVYAVSLASAVRANSAGNAGLTGDVDPKIRVWSGKGR
jgi:hypothetical protein